MDELLTKPRYGERCNRCGLCCVMARCKVSVEIFGEGEGPCPALEWNGSQSSCGVLARPDHHIPKFGLFRLLNGRKGVAEFQSQLAFTLAIGAGCDSSDSA